MDNIIFTQSKIGSINLANKILRSATHEGFADDRGLPTNELKGLYTKIARGEAGAIITGYAGIQANGKSPLKNMLMIDSDESIAHYKNIVDAVHEYKTPVILQIVHCGRQTRSKITGFTPVAPSPGKDKFYKEDTPSVLTEEEILEIIDNFVKAIERAQKAGFDGVQLHGAHGYLLNAFLSPRTNRRTDRWGGSTENRFRIIGEIFRKAKEKTGDYPILIKMNGYDQQKNGMTIAEAEKIAVLLEKAGCAAIEVSCGVFDDGLITTRSPKVPIEMILKYTFSYKSIPTFLKPLIKAMVSIFMPGSKSLTKYNVAAAQAIKEKVSIPVITVGGIGSLPDIKEIIENQQADFVSMCRPFIIEPDVVKKFKEQKQEKTKCIYCNHCIIASEENTLRCYYGKVK